MRRRVVPLERLLRVVVRRDRICIENLDASVRLFLLLFWTATDEEVTPTIRHRIVSIKVYIDLCYSCAALCASA